MVLESTMICVDNSEYMRNGDYVPTRLQAQQDAVNTICRYKLRSNPENNVGLITMSDSVKVLATLTTDVGKILTSLHAVQPNGIMNLLTGIRIAHLALKHRQSKNHKMRIVAFVGSPLGVDEKEVVRVAKRLKKENVQVDVINFGETEENQTLLEALVNTINGREGSGSHLVTVPPSPHLADALLTSPIVQGEEGGAAAASFATGGGFEFGVDPNEDPELALALRVSMEEQRQRQQEEEQRVAQESADGTGATPAGVQVATPTTEPSTGGESTTTAPATAASGGIASEDEMLQQALAMSLEAGGTAGTAGGLSSATPASSQGSGSAVVTSLPPPTAVPMPDFATMTEEEQIAYAMQISMQDCQSETMEVDQKAETTSTQGSSTKAGKAEEPMKGVEEGAAGLAGDDEDLTKVMSDAAFLEGVLNKLPGVNPNSAMVKQAIDAYAAQDTTSSDAKKSKKTDDKKEEDKNKEDKKKSADKDVDDSEMS